MRAWLFSAGTVVGFLLREAIGLVKDPGRDWWRDRLDRKRQERDEQHNALLVFQNHVLPRVEQVVDTASQQLLSCVRAEQEGTFAQQLAEGRLELPDFDEVLSAARQVDEGAWFSVDAELRMLAEAQRKAIEEVLHSLPSHDVTVAAVTPGLQGVREAHRATRRRTAELLRGAPPRWRQTRPSTR
jgi:hypothetical protein